ncbi:acyl carrier protein [Micromonospora ureilytica]|uniref:acyl carrier protein n=1 Tax=Micromonospora ureilytica TaxID=709868 RepID=UPI0033E25B9C
MTNLTLDRLMEIVKECAGDSGHADVTGDLSATRFDDLGYDSLARLETAARLQRQYGVRLTDEAVNEADTPGALLDLVNRALTAA